MDFPVFVTASETDNAKWLAERSATPANMDIEGIILLLKSGDFLYGEHGRERVGAACNRQRAGTGIVAELHFARLPGAVGDGHLADAADAHIGRVVGDGQLAAGQPDRAGDPG